VNTQKVFILFFSALTGDVMFGLGQGKIDIVIPKYNYATGDTITGTVKLDLKGQVHARELRLVFKGEQKTTSYSGSGVSMGSVRVGVGKQGKSTHVVVIHQFKLPLGGEKDYTSGEYPFEIAIPSSIQLAQRPDGVMGQVLGAAQFLAGATTSINWTLKASLDIPRAFDVSKTVQINVTTPAPKANVGNI
jgi:hypothetical protein